VNLGTPSHSVLDKFCQTSQIAQRNVIHQIINTKSLLEGIQLFSENKIFLYKELMDSFDMTSNKKGEINQNTIQSSIHMSTVPNLNMS